MIILCSISSITDGLIWSKLIGRQTLTTIYTTGFNINDIKGVTWKF